MHTKLNDRDRSERIRNIASLKAELNSVVPIDYQVWLPQWVAVAGIVFCTMCSLSPAAVICFPVAVILVFVLIADNNKRERHAFYLSMKHGELQELERELAIDNAVASATEP